ncbi:MAG: helix-turn-helix transcriptional regulator [Proteobacteria bacterium]|nr:helix-turn-helix transcriptional regulator [Pseudomonadota bacterium]
MRYTKQSIDARFVGQDFDNFLCENDIAAKVEALAIKKVVVALLQNSGMTQGELAERLQTSRSQVRRLLDPENTSITLSTLQRAADVTGHRLKIGFTPIKKRHSAEMARRKPAQ